jgi:hypothetical protein
VIQILQLDVHCNRASHSSHNAGIPLLKWLTDALGRLAASDSGVPAGREPPAVFRGSAIADVGPADVVDLERQPSTVGGALNADADGDAGDRCVAGEVDVEPVPGDQRGDVR